MRGLELRLRRLEERFRKKNNHAPSQHEFLEANTRQRTRNLYTAKSSPAGENWAWDRLSEYDQKMLEKDTENLRQQDKDVLRRSGGVHGPAAEETMGRANAARQRLRSVIRVKGLG